MKRRLVGGLVLILAALALSFLVPPPMPPTERDSGTIVIDLRDPMAVAREVDEVPRLPPAARSQAMPPTPAPTGVDTAAVRPPAPAPRPAATPLPRPAPPVVPTAAPIAPAATPTPVPATGVADGTWWVQVGAFSAREGAEQVRETLRVAGLNAVVQSVEVGQRTVHRVRIGPFNERLQADSAHARAVLLGHTNANVIRQ